MVTCPEWISGKESYIDCMHGGSVPDKVINSYCWISGTRGLGTLLPPHQEHGRRHLRRVAGGHD